MTEESDQLRTPDTYYNDRLLQSSFDPDEELHQVILQSRQEYMEREKKKLKRKQQQQNLQKRLAIPIARLTLWKNTTPHMEEQEHLETILHFLSLKMNPDIDGEESIPLEMTTNLHSFLEQYLKPSKLYQEIYDICIESKVI